MPGRGEISAERTATPLDPSSAAAPRAPVGWGFMAGYVVAQAGAYISFLPLLMILTPLKAAALAPGHKEALLSEIASLGAVVAALSNLLAGWVSDRTRLRWGRRRPWIVAGALATALSYGLVAASSTPAALIAAILTFQLVFNFAFAPLAALIPDRVPDHQKGWVSALTGLGLPIGSVVGSWVVGMLVLGDTTRYLVLALIVVLAIAPFAVMIRDPLPPVSREAPPPRLAADWRTAPRWPRFSADFVYVWIGRCLVQTAFGLVQIYLLFFLQEALNYGVTRIGRPEMDMARLSLVFAIANVASGLIAGGLSDRLGRRKPFVMAGAAIMAAASVGLAMAHAWPSILAGYAVLGCGAGCFFAVDLALVTQLLPSSRNTGRDLGVLNLSITIPQVVAPALAGLLLSAPGANLRWIFIVASMLGLSGAGMVALIRRIR